MELTRNIDLLLPKKTDIVIVGGGLAGLSLARALTDIQHHQEQKISHVVLDELPYGVHKDKFYLGGSYVPLYGRYANDYYLNLQADDTVPHISGAQYFAHSANRLDKIADIAPLPDTGYSPIPQKVLQRSLIKGSSQDEELDAIYHDTKVLSLHTEGEDTVLQTTKGALQTQVVVDCTGMNQAILGLQNKTAKDYIVCATFGGTMPVAGIQKDSLYFIRGIPDNSSNGIFPIRTSTKQNAIIAEVEVAHDLPKSGAQQWYVTAEQTFQDMQRLYESVGINISPKSEHHASGFRLEPSQRKEFEGALFPFGEAAGMNSPEHGQLADILPVFSRALAEILMNAATVGYRNVGMRFYDYWRSNPPFSYFLHAVMRENRKISPHIAILLKKAVMKTLTPEETWEMLQSSKMSPEQIAKLFLNAPLEMVAWSIANLGSIPKALLTS